LDRITPVSAVPFRCAAPHSKRVTPRTPRALNASPTRVPSTARVRRHPKTCLPVKTTKMRTSRGKKLARTAKTQPQQKMLFPLALETERSRAVLRCNIQRSYRNFLISMHPHVYLIRVDREKYPLVNAFLVTVIMS
jgi:hypothetical protein